MNKLLAVITLGVVSFAFYLLINSDFDERAKRHLHRDILRINILKCFQKHQAFGDDKGFLECESKFIDARWTDGL